MPGIKHSIVRCTSDRGDHTGGCRGGGRGRRGRSVLRARALPHPDPAGVSLDEVMLGLPEREPHEVETFIARFGHKLGH